MQILGGKEGQWTPSAICLSGATRPRWVLWNRRRTDQWSSFWLAFRRADSRCWPPLRRPLLTKGISNGPSNATTVGHRRRDGEYGAWTDGWCIRWLVPGRAGLWPERVWRPATPGSGGKWPRSYLDPEKERPCAAETVARPWFSWLPGSDSNQRPSD